MNSTGDRRASGHNPSRVANLRYNFRPSTVASREVPLYHREIVSKPLAIAKSRFGRLVRDLTRGFNSSLSIQNEPISALHQTAEDYLEELFKDASHCAHHAGSYDF